MIRVAITNQQLIVEPEGLDKLWAFTRQLRVPLGSIRAATVELYAPARVVFGLRFPGTHIPGLIKAGTFFEQGQREFWLVHQARQVVVIELEQQSYARLVLEVPDPNALVHSIYQALRDGMHG